MLRKYPFPNVFPVQECRLTPYFTFLTGMWINILQFLNVVGVVTNSFLIAFTSSWGAKYTTEEKYLIVIIFQVSKKDKEHIYYSDGEIYSGAELIS